jgi:hypothetical protein
MAAPIPSSKSCYVRLVLSFKLFAREKLGWGRSKEAVVLQREVCHEISKTVERDLRVGGHFENGRLEGMLAKLYRPKTCLVEMSECQKPKAKNASQWGYGWAKSSLERMKINQQRKRDRQDSTTSCC